MSDGGAGDAGAVTLSVECEPAGRPSSPNLYERPLGATGGWRQGAVVPHPTILR